LPTYGMSHHADWRCAQRNISRSQLEFILEHGPWSDGNGVIFVQLLKKSMPKDHPPNSHNWRLIGTTVVLCKCGCYVVTVIRDKKAIRKDYKKQKRCSRRRYGACPYCNK